MTPIERILPQRAADRAADADRESLAGCAKIRAAAAEYADPRMTPARCIARIKACAVQQERDPLNGPMKIFAAAGIIPAPPEDHLHKALAAMESWERSMAAVHLRPPSRPAPARQRPRLAPRRPAPSPAQAASTAAPAPADLPIVIGHPLAFWNFRDRLAGDLRRGRVGQTAREMVDHAASEYGLPKAEAADFVLRFFHGIKRDKAMQSRVSAAL